MRHILFVDDEPNILEGLQRMLFPLRKDWAMTFASSGAQALEAMEKQHFDVIVSDMRMPGMDGSQLLAEVKTRHPDTVRFVLTGQSDSETVYRSVGEAHQFLTKPCKPNQLKECVDRAFALRDLLTSDPLKAVVTQIGSLPPVPELYAMLCRELQSLDVSIANVGHIIERDLAMTAKILQLVNSAFFGLRQHISTATQAASLLGIDTIRALVMMTGLFSGAQNAKLPACFSLDALWRHSTTVGTYTQAICRSEGAPKHVLNDAFTAGLLHDSGQLILAQRFHKGYAQACAHAKSTGILLADAERELFGCAHAEVGAYLLGIWGLPNPIVETVAYHHRPADCPGGGFTPLTAVHVANALARASQKGESDLPLPQVDLDYLRGIGLESRLAEWEAACGAIDTTDGVPAS